MLTRAAKGTFPQISTWLKVTRKRSKDKKYEHLLGRENGAERDQVVTVLQRIIAAAHEDARRNLRALADPSLDPLGTGDGRDPADGYPQSLHMQTLKGYFGEVMAGLVAENLGAFGYDDWKVPAYLFRFHHVAFQQLDLIHQTDGEAKPLPGRTGDDCLAFRCNGDGDIVAALCCESKCTKEHKSTLIDDAYEKSSLPNLLPVDLLRLVEILRQANGEAASRWVRALLKLYQSDAKPVSGYERFDQITYVCGRQPKRKDCWISRTKPHAKYTAGRRLQVAEIQLNGVESLIKAAYGAA